MKQKPRRNLKRSRILIIPPALSNKSGLECSFYRLSKTRGLKIFFGGITFVRRVFARQKRAFKHGIGPETFGSIKKYRNSIYGICYGYETAVAKRAIKITQEEYDIFYNKVLDIFGELEDTGFEIDSTRNMGRINGKLVMVDFGDCSFG